MLVFGLSFLSFLFSSLASRRIASISSAVGSDLIEWIDAGVSSVLAGATRASLLAAVAVWSTAREGGEVQLELLSDKWSLGCSAADGVVESGVFRLLICLGIVCGSDCFSVGFCRDWESFSRWMKSVNVDDESVLVVVDERGVD